MPANENIHDEMLWRLRDHFARDGAITPDEQALLDAQEDVCQRMSAVHGLLYSPGGIPRRVRRARPDLAAVAVAAITG